VVGVRCSLEVRQVARHARDVVQRVVIINVAIGAGARRDRMQSGERKSSFIVIECRAYPAAGGVTGLARLGESAGNVVGIRSPLEILEVA